MPSLKKRFHNPPITAPTSGEVLFVRADTPTAIFSFSVTISYSIVKTILSFDVLILTKQP